MIGRLEEPLLEPDANEREGYVPNVVYSCGGRDPQPRADHPLRHVRLRQHLRHDLGSIPSSGRWCGADITPDVTVLLRSCGFNLALPEP